MQHYDVCVLLADYERTWVGGTDEEDEGTWVWSGTKQQLDYTNWAIGEPGGLEGDCMYLNRDYSGKWCDNPCETKYNFVCEASE